MSTHKIAIVTDSTNDLPQELCGQYALRVVPLYIVWGQQQYVDGLDLTAEAFYERLKDDPVLPGTSQPTPQDFGRVYREAQEQGAEEIVALTLSGGLSGTIQSARQAAEAAQIPVHVVDSKSTSMGLGWQALAAARVRDAGGSVKDILGAIDAVRRRLVFIVSLDTLDYLRKGGRIGGAVHFIGSLLDLKPQVWVNHETGLVEAGERTRSRPKAIESLFRSFFKKIDLSRPLHVAVQHSGAVAEAQALLERVRSEYNPVELITTLASPVLGVHAGPAALALVGYSEP